MKKGRIITMIAGAMMVATLSACGATETSVEIASAETVKTPQSESTDVSAETDTVTNTEAPVEDAETQVVTLEKQHLTYTKDGYLDTSDEYEYDARGNCTWHAHSEIFGMLCYTEEHPDGYYFTEGYEDKKEYDESDNVIKSSGYKFSYTADENKTIPYTYEYKYDKFNNMVEEIVYDTAGNVSERYEYKYDKFNNGTEVVEYDADGSVVSQTEYEYEYDKTGNAINAIVYYSDSSISGQSKIEYIYDESGNRTGLILYNSDGSVTHYDVDEEGNTTISNKAYEYDEAGNVTKILQYDGLGGFNFWTEFKYDEAGNQIKETYYNAEGVACGGKDNEYDTAGNLVRTTQYAENGNKMYTDEFVYDANGDIASQTTYDFGRNVINTLTYHYEYDTTGKLIHSIVYYSDGGVKQQEDWTYDAEGRKTRHKQIANYAIGDTFDEEWNYDANGNIASYNKYGSDGKLAEYIEYVTIEK